MVFGKIVVFASNTHSKFQNSLKILKTHSNFGVVMLTKTLRCGDVGFGIWLSNTTSPQRDVCYKYSPTFVMWNLIEQKDCEDFETGGSKLLSLLGSNTSPGVKMRLRQNSPKERYYIKVKWAFCPTFPMPMSLKGRSAVGPLQPFKWVNKGEFT